LAQRQPGFFAEQLAIQIARRQRPVIQLEQLPIQPALTPGTQPLA